MEQIHAVVRLAGEADIAAIAEINMQCFHGDRGSPETARAWMSCRIRQYPMYRIFVATLAEEVVGYIGWEIHGGFRRSDPIVELEQIGIAPPYQNLKIGALLQEQTMEQMTELVRNENQRVESHISFIVWVYAHNLRAINTYLKVFTDGIVGMRSQYGNKTEVMLRRQSPLVMNVPMEER